MRREIPLLLFGGQRLGPELAPSFDSANWTVSGADATHVATFSAGTLRYQSDTTTPALNVRAIGILTVGKRYRAIVTTTVASGSIKTDSFGGNTVIASASGELVIEGVASLTAFEITRNSAGVDVTFTKALSIREVL